jgi:DNA repair protein RadD
MPEVGCCILARPTKQMGLYRQMVGRVLRPADGKLDAVILDHSGVVYRHGLPEDHVEWTLAVDRRAVNPAQAKRDRGEAPKLHECPSCKVVMVAPPCGACGWQPQPRARAVDFEDGELGLVTNGKANAHAYTKEEKALWYQMLIGEALRRGKKPGWAWYLFRDKFGHEPNRFWNRTALAPTPEVFSYVRSRIIAYAKAKERSAA